METITVNARPNNLPLILLDDVYTSGASMRACERLLRAQGVTVIYKLALGKTI
jgi:predicted amidophosphoribosyltransferase